MNEKYFLKLITGYVAYNVKSNIFFRKEEAIFRSPQRDNTVVFQREKWGVGYYLIYLRSKVNAIIKILKSCNCCSKP